MIDPNFEQWVVKDAGGEEEHLFKGCVYNGSGDKIGVSMLCPIGISREHVMNRFETEWASTVEFVTAWNGDQS